MLRSDVDSSASRLGPFLRFAVVLGLTGFGGGYVMSERIRRTVVDEKKWLDNSTFFECFAVANAIPGSLATNLMSLLGLRLIGGMGALLGAMVFLAPSVLLMVLFGAYYDAIARVDVLMVALNGMSVATVGLVASVTLSVGKAAPKDRVTLALAAGTALALVFHALSLLEVFAVAGLIGVFVMRPTPSRPPPPGGRPRHLPDAEGPRLPAIVGLPALPMLGGVGISMSIFVIFARIGVATFGGGYTIIAAIESEVVSVHRWLDAESFNHAVVFGQITPGPVLIVSTFIGYRISGIVGALCATFGMFSPPFVLSLLAGRSLGVFHNNTYMQGFLKGIAPTIVGAIAAAAVLLWQTSVHSAYDSGLALVSFLLLVGFPKLSPLIPIFGAAAIKVAFHRL